MFRRVPPTQIVELAAGRYARATISRTFEGRDRFAPAAAWLARGLALTALGASTGSWQHLEVPEPVLSDDRMSGEVVRVDRFGNLVTNIDRQTLTRFAKDAAVEISVAGASIVGLVATYPETAPGSVCAMFGSTDHLEIARNGGNAAGWLARRTGNAGRRSARTTC